MSRRRGRSWTLLGMGADFQVREVQALSMGPVTNVVYSQVLK